MIHTLDVIWIHDDEIRPPGPKMVVCVEPNIGLYFRINTNDNWQPCIPVRKEPDHLFLSHDSFIQCVVLELDDYIIKQAIIKNGIIGQVSKETARLLSESLGYVNAPQSDKVLIRSALKNIK